MSLRLALAQINTTVGDINGNKNKILEQIKSATQKGVDVLAFPELTITGYPPEDLLLRQQFLNDQFAAVEEIASHVKNMVCVVGCANHQNGKLYNAAAVLQRGEIKSLYRKIHLPNYSVFDEDRYFEPGNEPLVIDVNGAKIGISICEDVWVPDDVTTCQAQWGGAQVLLNMSASPFFKGKINERIQLLQNQAKSDQCVVAYCNLVGGQDELVFDGQSLIVNENGELQAIANAFQEDMLVYDIILNERHDNDVIECKYNVKTVELDSFENEKPALNPREYNFEHDELSEVYSSLTTGIYDYVTKNGFSKVVFGLSGGIDSALVAALAADALGPENVTCITMPSQYSSTGSVDDSVLLAENFGIKLYTIPIKDMFDKYEDALAEPFAGTESDVAEENIQARIRGGLVMAMSNKFNMMALATGNKSEVSVGYCTIYGDMVGGFSPLKDVNKMLVYRLSEYRNKLAGYDIIPQAIIDKAPSAELRPDQTDQDSLPPYDILDAILELYVEQDLSVKEIVAKGFEEETVKRVAWLVDINEYKRRQGAPGIKITQRAFGKDRRMPITNYYKAK